MIGRITGVLKEKTPPQILVDVAGVGYEISVPMSTFYKLPDINAHVSVLTHFVVREDAQTLYGFLTEIERASFRALVKVTGIGARTALSILSGLSPEELAQAIAEQNLGVLTRVPGIGKRTAERLLLEMKDKLPAAKTSVTVGAAPSSGDDILNALIALGYHEKEAAAAVRALPKDVDVSAGIKQALQYLSKA
ncbi:MAG: Holliday junction branch migration protein RuvA [Burkholderiales bacterium]|jgi:Holliday junction DNA helicase RuvA|nr:Holliday junction branch migration protein RuvA [Burkholderiales bacterium]